MNEDRPIVGYQRRKCSAETITISRATLNHGNNRPVHRPTVRHHAHEHTFITAPDWCRSSDKPIDLCCKFMSMSLLDFGPEYIPTFSLYLPPMLDTVIKQKQTNMIR